MSNLSLTPETRHLWFDTIPAAIAGHRDSFRTQMFRNLTGQLWPARTMAYGWPAVSQIDSEARSTEFHELEAHEAMVAEPNTVPLGVPPATVCMETVAGWPL